MFRPRDSYDQRLLSSNLSLNLSAETSWIHDVFGNCVAIVIPSQPGASLEFKTAITVDHTPSDAPAFATTSAAMDYPFEYEADEMADLEPTRQRQYSDEADEIGKWARRFQHAGAATPTGNLLMTLCNAIRESFVYERRLEAGTQPPLFTLHHGRGTCRDFAVFMMEAVRSLGFAARFVTGYIYVPSRDRVERQGGGSTHAWCQVYVPGAGWVEFDPTNGIVGNQDLIRVAVARNPGQAVPLHGSYNGLKSDFLGMTVEVRVAIVSDSERKRGEGFASHSFQEGTCGSKPATN